MKQAKRSIVILYRDLCEEWIDILKRGHFNTLGLHFIPDRFEMEGYLEWLDREGRALIGKVEQAGIAVEHELHALRYLLPRSLFETHPEYFRVDREGVRTAKHNCCSASAEALSIIEERAYRLACGLKQSGHRYYLWSDDSTDSWCHCEVCQGRTPSDQNLILLQAILAGLRRYDAEAELSYLAYLGSIEPPTSPIPEGLFLEFAPIKRDMFQPLSSEVNREHQAVVERLLAAFPAQRAEILEYWLDVSLYTKWGKLPLRRVPFHPEVLEADFDYYASLGVCGIKTFGAFMDRDYLKTYGDEEIVAYGKMLYERFS